MKSFNEHDLNESRLDERMKINPHTYKQQELDDRFGILEEILEYFK